MTVTACPHCHGRIELKALGAARQQKADPADKSHLDRATLRAVLSFMRWIGTGTLPFAEIRRRYNDWAPESNGPTVSDRVLAGALKLNGAWPYRNAVERGYFIPFIPVTQLPAPPPPTVAAEEERRDLEEAIAAHQGVDGAL